MKTKENVKKVISGVVKNLAFKAADKDMNSACVFFQYQPKLPKTLKKIVQ